MQIYLPIAEMSVNIFLLLGLGGITGILSGMFGVGGGFLLTPFLLFIGVPPSVSVATSANQIVASSVSGFLAHWRKNNVDFKMGNFLLVGGLAGSTLGVELFGWLKSMGHIDLIIMVFYSTFLGLVGALMAYESGQVIFRKKKKSADGKRSVTGLHLREKLPFKTEFARSKIYVSGVLPVVIGLLVGIMVSLMGIGGGFFLIPAMIYLLRMPTSVVIGTSLYQIIFITANVTILQAVTTQTVDIVLALLLLSGSVIGAQIGSKIGEKMPAEHLRGLLAALVLGVAVKLGLGLFATPADPFTIISEIPL